MTDDIKPGYVPPPELELYFELVTRMYERMEKEGFPWAKEELPL